MLSPIIDGVLHELTNSMTGDAWYSTGLLALGIVSLLIMTAPRSSWKT